MNPSSLEKLWKRSKGKLPHLALDDYTALLPVAQQLYRPSAKYWGLVDSRHRVDGRSLVHCFNFGNITVKFPWEAEAVNLGQRVPLIVSGSGTIRPRKTFRSLLHQVEAAFLVFELEQSTLVEERLQPGFFLTERASAMLRTSCEIVFMPGCELPRDGIFFYYLTKRINFSSEPISPLRLEHPVPVELPRARMTWNEPMLIEPGWSMLLLEKDRWVWGIIAL